MRVAMWSGPRNLSTAMMYSFGARPDFAVRDEPFYAAWLAATGTPHPMRAEVLAAQETDPGVVAAACAGPPPDGARHFYQKHMLHHIDPAFDLGWVEACRHGFLIRHPARVVASYLAKREDPSAADLGFEQQDRLFEQITARTGRPPLVLDATDLRAAPEPMLRALCDGLGLPFDPAMLGWPAGGHPSDGVWAAHWYGAVHRSTGFAGAEGPLPELPPRAAALAGAGVAGYERLAARKIAPSGPAR